MMRTVTMLERSEGLVDPLSKEFQRTIYTAGSVTESDQKRGGRHLDPGERPKGQDYRDRRLSSPIMGGSVAGASAPRSPFRPWPRLLGLPS